MCKCIYVDMATCTSACSESTKSNCRLMTRTIKLLGSRDRECFDGCVMCEVRYGTGPQDKMLSLEVLASTQDLLDTKGPQL